MRRVGLALAVLALGALGACGGPASSPSPSPSGGNAGSSQFPLIFEVAGDGAADITYASELGQPSTQISAAATPWTKTLQLSSGAAAAPAATVTARTSSTGKNATITCRIKIAGMLVEAKTARGPHALAECSTT